MSIEELNQHQLPNYSKAEEIFNMVSHIVGGSCGIMVLCIAIFLSILFKRNAYEIISLIIYGVSIISLYSISSIYHGLKKEKFSKKILQIIDHCTIYFLICGTYTPICVMGNYSFDLKIFVLTLQYGLAIFGIIINAVALNKKIVKIISMILYILMGWMIIFIPIMVQKLPLKVFLFILFGGIFYTLGSILYGIGAKKRWFHSIFHIFCVLGTLFQAIGIILLI